MNNSSRFDALLAQSREHQRQRENSYRGQALKMYPWICGRCTREFTNKNLHELTVHHRDHNHDNNPSDGSNWELLCLYCHDNEHSKQEEFLRNGYVEVGQEVETATFNPFADLKNMLDKK